MRELTAEECVALLAEGKLFCYFRNARRNAESGYPAIEYGYAQMHPEQFRVVARRKLCSTPDILVLHQARAWQDDPNFDIRRSVDVDVTEDGYWRVCGQWRWDERLLGLGSGELLFPPKETRDAND